MISGITANCWEWVKMAIPEHWLAFGFVVMMVAMSIVGEGDRQEALNEHAHYCKMIHLHKISNGKSGWPDYENRREACKI